MTTIINDVRIAPCAEINEAGDVAIVDPTSAQFWSVYVTDQNGVAQVPVGGDHKTQQQAFEHARSIAIPGVHVQMQTESFGTAEIISRPYNSFWLTPVHEDSVNGMRDPCTEEEATHWEIYGALDRDTTHPSYEFDQAVFPNPSSRLASCDSRYEAEWLLGALLSTRPAVESHEDLTD